MPSSEAIADMAAQPGTNANTSDAAPHQLHDDSLLASLVLVTRLLGRPCTAQQLSSGLPLVDQRLTPSLLAKGFKGEL